MAKFLIIETDGCFGLPVKASTAGQSFKAWEKSEGVLNQTDLGHWGPNSDLFSRTLRCWFHHTSPELGFVDRSKTQCPGRETLAELWSYYLSCSLLLFSCKKPFSSHPFLFPNLQTDDLFWNSNQFVWKGLSIGAWELEQTLKWLVVLSEQRYLASL